MSFLQKRPSSNNSNDIVPSCSNFLIENGLTPQEETHYNNQFSDVEINPVLTRVNSFAFGSLSSNSDIETPRNSILTSTLPLAGYDNKNQFNNHISPEKLIDLLNSSPKSWTPE
jgi:hypothetical protein